MKGIYNLINVLFMSTIIAACTGNPTKSVEVQTGTKKISDSKSKRPSPPMLTSVRINETIVSLSYSSPSVKEREIWGSLIPYGKIWRTGANEANIFDTNKDVLINGQELPAGKYALFTIPGEEKWSVIFNTVYEQWGAYDYDSAKNQLVIEVVPNKSPEMQDLMRFEMQANGTVDFAWEYLRWSFKVDEVRD